MKHRMIDIASGHNNLLPENVQNDGLLFGYALARAMYIHVLENSWLCLCRYFITEAGCKLAEKLLAVENASPLKVGRTVNNNKQQAAKQKPKGLRPKSHQTKNVVEDRSHMQSVSEASETFVGDDLQHPVLPMHSFANRFVSRFVNTNESKSKMRSRAERGCTYRTLLQGHSSAS
jgi:hypothetical protein